MQQVLPASQQLPPTQVWEGCGLLKLKASQEAEAQQWRLLQQQQAAQLAALNGDYLPEEPAGPGGGAGGPKPPKLMVKLKQPLGGPPPPQP